jgi:hypothetical protein
MQTAEVVEICIASSSDLVLVNGIVPMNDVQLPRQGRHLLHSLKRLPFHRKYEASANDASEFSGLLIDDRYQPTMRLGPRCRTNNVTIAVLGRYQTDVLRVAIAGSDIDRSSSLDGKRFL